MIITATDTPAPLAVSLATRGDAGVFVRHRGPITCVTGVPGTRRAVSSGYDGAVGMVDLDAGGMTLLGYHDHLVNRIAVNDSGTLAASAGSDYSIYIWDLRRGVCANVLIGHADDVEDFAFAGATLGVSASRDRRVLVWDLATGAIVRALDGHERDVLSVVCHDGRVYTSGDDMTLRMWDLETGRMLRMWGPFEHETDSCAVDPIRGRVILGCDDGVLRVLDIASGAPAATIPAHACGIKRVAASPATGALLSAAYDQRVLIWNADTFEQEVELERHPATWERSFNWSPDGRSILAGTFEGTVIEWDAASGRRLREIGDGRGNACLNEVSSNARGDIVTVSDDGVVRLGRLTPGEARWTAETAPAAGRVLMNAVTMDDAHDLVIAGAHDHTLHIWTHAGHALRDEVCVPLGQGPINAVRVSRHPGSAAEAFVACYSGAVVRVTREGAVRGIIPAHDGAVKALRLHPTLPIGVSCAADGTLHSWSFEGERLHRYLGHTAIVDDVDIDPSGRLIASAGRDFTLKLHDVHSGHLVDLRPLGHKSPKAVCFFDEQTVVVTNYWGMVFRYDVRTGELIRRQIAHNGLSCAARCGAFVAATSYDGAVYLVRPDDLSVVSVLRAMQQRLHPPTWAPASEAS